LTKISVSQQWALPKLAVISLWMTTGGRIFCRGNGELPGRIINSSGVLTCYESDEQSLSKDSPPFSSSYGRNASLSSFIIFFFDMHL
jgi:hypothetical protein